MANYTVTISQGYEPGFTTFTVSPASRTIAIGDSLTFRRQDLGGSTQTITVSGFSSSRFTSTAPVTLSSNGATGARTSNAIGSNTLTITAPGMPTLYFTVNINSGISSYPDAFSFFSVSLAQPNMIYESSVITISGINTSVSATISGGGSFKINNETNWRTSGTVNDGDKIKLRLTSANAYSAAVATTLTVGGRSGTWTITTAADPEQGEVIAFPYTAGTFNFTDIIDFFGGRTNYGNVPPRNLRAYLKGAGLVPNISKNAAIPTSGTLNKRDFLGSGTALYFANRPAGQVAGGMNSFNAITPSVRWEFFGPYAPHHPRLGFGNIALTCEYRFRVAEYTGTDYTTGVSSTISGSVGASYSAWSTKSDIEISTHIPAGVQRFYGGVVYMQVRSSYDPSVILTGSATYSLESTGL